MALRNGLIFDLDGVLTDTEEFHFRSWSKLADELGLEFGRVDAEELRGRSRTDALELFLGGRLAVVDRGPLLERKNRYFLEEIADLGPKDLAPGALELLDEARAAGVGVGLASSSRNARVVCDRLGILQRFDAFADGCSRLRPKPAPDIFVWVAGRLGLEPALCTVVEDSGAGIRAAREGGFRTVGVGPPERVGEAGLVVPDLRELSLGDLYPLSERWPARATGSEGSSR